jgi:uncharacterized membrane protein
MAEESQARRRFMKLGFLIAGVASIVALIALVLTGIEKVNTGHGLDTYRTTWLVEFNWVGFLVLVVAVIVALAGGLVMRYLEWREIRQLQNRYGANHDV